MSSAPPVPASEDNIDDVLANPVETGGTPNQTPGSCLSGPCYAYLFCFTTTGARKTGKAAISYAQDPSNFHYGVPFSSKTGGGSLRNKTHPIHVIYYLTKDGGKRTNKQLDTCNAYLFLNRTVTKKGSCTAKLLALSGPTDGWGRARLLEASMVLRYVVGHATRLCPPGQVVSCR